MKKIILSFLTGVLFTVAFSQETVLPTPPQKGLVFIKNATIHVGNGQTIENGTVAFEKGKLTYVGATSGAPSDQSKYDVVNAAGKHVYPGFIIMNSQLGLQEVSAVPVSELSRPQQGRSRISCQHLSEAAGWEWAVALGAKGLAGI